jgi:RNA polymerase sigma factor (sigma-70 family)
MSLSCTKTRGPGLLAEATLFHQAQSGDRKALDDLMARHERLVHAIIQRHGWGPLAYAATLQAGRIGLWHAILKYDPTRGFAFSTYAWTCIMRRIWQTVKVETRPARRGLATPMFFCVGATNPAQLIEQRTLTQAMQELVQRLPGRLQFTIVAHYGLDGDTPANFAEIGRGLGLSEERARQLHCEALLWLRQPAHSQTLRSLLDRHTPTDYPALDALQQRWWYPRRGRDER